MWPKERLWSSDPLKLNVAVSMFTTPPKSSILNIHVENVHFMRLIFCSTRCDWKNQNITQVQTSLSGKGNIFSQILINNTFTHEAQISRADIWSLLNSKVIVMPKSRALKVRWVRWSAPVSLILIDDRFYSNGSFTGTADA